MNGNILILRQPGMTSARFIQMLNDGVWRNARQPWKQSVKTYYCNEACWQVTAPAPGFGLQ